MGVGGHQGIKLCKLGVGERRVECERGSEVDEAVEGPRLSNCLRNQASEAVAVNVKRRVRILNLLGYICFNIR